MASLPARSLPELRRTPVDLARLGSRVLASILRANQMNIKQLKKDKLWKRIPHEAGKAIYNNRTSAIHYVIYKMHAIETSGVYFPVDVETNTPTILDFRGNLDEITQPEGVHEEQGRYFAGVVCHVSEGFVSALHRSAHAGTHHHLKNAMCWLVCFSISFQSVVGDLRISFASFCRFSVKAIALLLQSTGC